MFQTLGGVPIDSLKDSMKIPMHNGSNLQIITVVRNQLPFLGAYAMTTYKIQGKTVEKIICDTHKLYADHAALYVMLSRVKSLEQLILLDELNTTRCNTPLPAEFENHIKFLHSKLNK